eukprot:14006455-Alexandrium_andersonii.AAC.1
MHGLAQLEHPREPPAHGPRCGGREEAQGPDSPGVHGQDLHLAAGEGRALLARAPYDRRLLERGVREGFDGAAGGSVRDRAHVPVRHDSPRGP